MTEDVQAFACACIHCLSTYGAGSLRRLFGPPIQGMNPNVLVLFDYIGLRPSTNGDKYKLILRDDHLDYKSFSVSKHTCGERCPGHH